ncbi:MAG: phosphate regulon sensor histidine kinase PhoR [Woeseia sp.]|nr:phosphate regulon sensor histidine kinase PhoR [Woeseia sp.]
MALLIGGVLIGALYGAPWTGLLFAALAALAYQIRQLLRFERALSTASLEELSFGEGIWSELAARVSFLRQRVKKNKRRHRRLLKEVRNSTNAMPDGAVVLSDRYEILLSNKAAEKLAGVHIMHDRGQRIDNILRDPKLVEHLSAAAPGTAVEIASPVAEERWLSCRLVPFGGNQFLLLLRDVTETVLIDKMRRDFVANASHELRSPLTVISGYLDVLVGDNDVPAEWHKPLAQMHAQADRMNRIVAELLELSRLENPQAERSEGEVDVPALLATARRAYTGEPGVPELDINTSSTKHLHGVSAEIESVINNLLTNAIRHTPVDGKINLSWNSSPDGGAILTVTDNGEGIDPEHLPRLTERFFRADAGRSRDAGGVGLGLAIVKHALLLHDAHLEIESKPGEGSRFSCYFPAARLGN